MEEVRADDSIQGEALNQIASLGESDRGNFFIIDARNWGTVCDLGLYEAVAYLVLAQGTGANNRSTNWSTDSLRRYAGMRWERAKAAIEHLIDSGLVLYGPKHSQTKPRYELASPAEAAGTRYRTNLAAISAEDRALLETFEDGKQRYNPTRLAAFGRLEAAGLVKKTADERFFRVGPPLQTDDSDKAELIWLPNTLITGTNEGEDPPIKRMRQTGDVWALRLLVDLYREQNLRDDGGIKPASLHQAFEQRKVGEYGFYTIWAFKPSKCWVCRQGALKVHYDRKPSEPDGPLPFWSSHELLLGAGLLSYVPHVWDNDPSKGVAEIVYPHGGLYVNQYPGAEQAEVDIGLAAQIAALRAAHRERVEAAEKDGFTLLGPVSTSIPNACMVGVARLRYRPHTSRTGAWASRLGESSVDWVNKFQSIAPIRNPPV